MLTLVDVHDLVLTDLNDVAIVKHASAHAFATQIDAVGAVQIFESCGLSGGDDLRVMTADVLAVDLQIVVGRAAHDEATEFQFALGHRLSADSENHSSETHAMRRRRF